MKTTIQIKSIFGKLLFELEKEGNTVKHTVEEAVKQGANLYGANLIRADLDGARLVGANLDGANLIKANLYGANLDGANLDGADLDGANLIKANLYGLIKANLYGANLDGANLIRADLDGANLDGANLDKIYSQNTILPEGDLIVWKKLKDGLIAQLLVPAEAKRVNAIGSRKCRFSYVKTIAIWDGKERLKEGMGMHNNKTLYKVGKITRPDSFDPSPLIECSHGIHGFITKDEALNY